MARVLWFCLKLVALVAVAVLLADLPGEVSVELPGYRIDVIFFALEWPGYRLDTSVGMLALGLGLVAAAAALGYRFWRFLIRAPGDIGRAVQAGRRRRGYKALTQGMVAVAAGEAEEAARWAKKAGALLDEPPLTMLLSAQAAQLTGDEAAARRYFTSMLDSEETRFLGLRGLLRQALRDGDDKAALGYVRRAHALRPRTPWVLTALFDLSERRGDFKTAERAVKEAARIKALSAGEANRRRAVLLLERAMAAHGGGDRAALKAAREALRLAPDLVPGALFLAERLVAAGQGAKAAKVLEKTWGLAPHPELARLYLAARPADDGIERLQRLGRLTAAEPEHPESHRTLPRAAFEARLWGEARRHLKAAAAADGLDGAPSESICRLMAELEEAEHGDAGAARAWLVRAAEAPADPGWVCGACGAVADAWSPRCGACAAFDALAWRRPPRVAGLETRPEAPAQDAADEASLPAAAEAPGPEPVKSGGAGQTGRTDL
ncbi:MAG: heme biosynthesis protein HemY [Kiloniellaceae bacterium]